MSISYSFIEINLSTIKTNYKRLCSQINKGQVAATVKSDCYGLGLPQIALTLYKAECRNFFVNDLSEGITLRSLLPDANIFILHGIFKGEEKAFLEYNLIPVLNNKYQFEILYDYLKIHSNSLSNLLPYSVALHINTGMNRLGMVQTEIKWLCDKQEELLKFLKVEYVISHLSNSNNRSSHYNQFQLNNLKQEINKLNKNGFTNLRVSLANSAGIFLSQEYHFDLVRPGSAIYGINPIPESENNIMLNPVRWVSKIIQIVSLDKNSYIGYNLTYKALAGTKIATVPIGYADGFPRNLMKSREVFFLNGIKLPVIGQVSMNLITLDVSNVPESLLHIGKEVEIIGPNMTIDKFAGCSGVFAYELLVNITGRSIKRYTNLS